MFVWFLFICLFVSIGPIIKDVFCISLEQPNLVKLVIKCAHFLFSRCSHFWSCQLTRYLFLEGPGNLTGLESCLVFLWDGGFKRFENCAIKLSAKENEWTGNGVKACLSIEILISKYGFGPVKLLELSRNGPQVTHGFCDDQRSLGYLL